jgi:hypothetical protein
VQGTSDTAVNSVAAVGAGLSGPVMALAVFGGLNMVAVVPIAPVLLFAAVLARSPARARQPAESR